MGGDPYHEHEATAKLCARFVSHLFPLRPLKASTVGVLHPSLILSFAHAQNAGCRWGATSIMNMRRQPSSVLASSPPLPTMAPSSFNGQRSSSEPYFVVCSRPKCRVQVGMTRIINMRRQPSSVLASSPTSSYHSPFKL